MERKQRTREGWRTCLPFVCPPVCLCATAARRRLASGTLLLDLPDLPHGLLQDGAFVWLDVEAVDVGEVGRDELRQLLDVFALLLPPTLVTPAKGTRVFRNIGMTTTLPCVLILKWRLCRFLSNFKVCFLHFVLVCKNLLKLLSEFLPDKAKIQ